MKFFLDSLYSLLFRKKITGWEEFYRNGYIVKKKFLSEQECDHLISQFRDQEESMLWKDKVGSDSRWYRNGFLLTPEQSREHDLFARQYIGRKIVGFDMMGNVSFKEGNLGSGGGWHRDSVNRRQLKFMVYLSDVDVENGAFEYVAGSHKLLSKVTTNFFRRSSRYNTSFQGDLLTGKKGTLILFDSSGLHRGTPLSRGERWAITRYYFNKTIPANVRVLLK